MRAAFAVITALVATSAGGTFTDPPGDAPGAPDVTRVTVSTRSGPAAFVIQAAGSWDDAASILAVDTNGDGTADVDYTVHSLHDMLTRDSASGAIPTGATFSFSGSTLTYEIPLGELGAFESGVAASLIGAVPAVVVGGAVTIAFAAVWSRVFPALARVDRMETLAPAAETD